MPDDTSSEQQAASAPVQTAAAPGAKSTLLSRLWQRTGGALTPRVVDAQPASAVPTTEALAVQIEQVALDANTPVATIVQMLVGETKEVTEVIQSLDDNKERVLGRIVKAIVTVACYILPWLLAFYAGAALGYTYSGGAAFNLLHTSSAYYYIVSWGYEIILVALMIGMVTQFKRLNGRRGLPLMITLVVLFLVLSITSASAQWILFESHINMADRSQVIGAVFRTLGTPLIDFCGAVVLAVLHIRSLEQQLETMQRKNEASIAINKKTIQNRLEVIEAAMQVKGSLQKEQYSHHKNELANAIISMFSENAIETIRDSLQGKRNQDGGSFRRDGYR